MRQEQSPRIEPGFGKPVGQIPWRPAALFRMPGERRVVDTQQVRIILGSKVVPDRNAGVRAYRGQIGQCAPHLMQPSQRHQPQLRGERLGGR
ncbi:Uncharacterised protein [Mycobacteroides abscessus subsp. abscessus]|nr:Uncharacterised protein [Mycobacteroides abscessus subsp. abscessus]